MGKSVTCIAWDRWLIGIKFFRKFIRPVFFNHQQFDVIEEIPNEKGNLWLLKLGKSIDSNSEIRPACLPQPESVITSQLTEACWADGSWFNEIKLTKISNSSCDENSAGYNKNIRIQGVEDELTVCASVKSGDADRCNVRKYSILFNFHLFVKCFHFPETWCFSVNRPSSDFRCCVWIQYPKFTNFHSPIRISFLDRNGRLARWNYNNRNTPPFAQWKW